MRPKTLLLSIIIAFITMFLFAYLKDSPQDVQRVVDQIEKNTPKKVDSYLINSEDCSFTLDLQVKKLSVETGYKSECPKDFVKDLISLSKSKNYFLYVDKSQDSLDLNSSVVKVFSVENKDSALYTLKTFQTVDGQNTQVLKLAVLDNDLAVVLYKTSPITAKVSGDPKIYLLAYNLPQIYKYNPFNIDSMYNIQIQNDQFKLFSLDELKDYKLVKFESSKVKFEDSKGVNLKEIDLTNGL